MEPRVHTLVEGKIGPNTASLPERVMQERQTPEHGFRSCLGNLRLARMFTPERLERASRKALEKGGRSFLTILSGLCAACGVL
jgi:hypothetical protein